MATVKNPTKQINYDDQLESTTRRPGRDDLRGCKTRLYTALAAAARMQKDARCNGNDFIENRKTGTGIKKRKARPQESSAAHLKKGSGEQVVQRNERLVGWSNRMRHTGVGSVCRIRLPRTKMAMGTRNRLWGGVLGCHHAVRVGR